MFEVVTFTRNIKLYVVSCCSVKFIPELCSSYIAETWVNKKTFYKRHGPFSPSFSLQPPLSSLIFLCTMHISRTQVEVSIFRYHHHHILSTYFQTVELTLQIQFYDEYVTFFQLGELTIHFYNISFNYNELQRVCT